jgi:predicted RNase H-like HicB family nuclease
LVESIKLNVRLRGFTRRDKPGRYVAGVPSLNVYSQGETPKDARRSLQEAVQLWFESCIERGTLERALQEVGFVPSPWGASPDEEIVRVSAEDAALLGEPTEVAVEIPAYQGAALLARPSFAAL